MDGESKFFTGLSRDRFALIDRGELLGPLSLRPCRLRMLMLVDVTISFSHAYFGLSSVLDTLRENPEYFVKFDITRAHRQTDGFKPDPITEPVLHERYGPHFENFRFTQPGFDINEYDQVWFFGFYSDPGNSDPRRLLDAELEILARWMEERRGGVFATGDHADLGEALCSRIPRVGTMRDVGRRSPVSANRTPPPRARDLGTGRERPGCHRPTGWAVHSFALASGPLPCSGP